MEKTYPFSRRRVHDIDFYRNHLFCLMCDMESGEIPMDKKQYDWIYDMYYGPLEDLSNAIYGSRNPYVVYLTGKQIGLAKQIVVWASERRASSLVEAGKLEYLQYC